MSSEQENMRRALDEMRMQNDDNMKTINARNSECAATNRELLETRHRLQERETEIDELRKAIHEVEQKNRHLSDKINEIIYNKATNYKNKTL
jgi:septal ring factor EnvC (AmiA/AmiB activator)